MKFKAQPNLFVRIANKYVQRVTGKKGFYFDGKGEYETDNEILIKALSQNFDTVKEESNAVEKTIKSEEIKLKKCKKCSFECENQGDLLAHYRIEHPKKEE